MPDDYICPITAEIMTDPVTTLDGFTYERTAILEWLRTKDTSPVTGATMVSTTLIPNLVSTASAASSAALPRRAARRRQRHSRLQFDRR